MGLRDTVESQVASAFDLLGDLKQTIVFNIASNRGYDFSTGEVSESNASISLEGVVEYTAINEDDDSSGILNGLRAKFILDRADLQADYNQFDSFTTDGKTYKILSVEDNGYSLEGIGVSG